MTHFRQPTLRASARTALGAMALAAGLASPGGAQGLIAKSHTSALVVSDRNAKPNEAAPLDRMVTLDVQNVQLEAVLDTIAHQASVRLIYGENVIGLNHRVTVRDTKLTVRQALERVLRGTGIVPKTTSGGITLVKPSVADSADATKGKGRISGRITDSTSGKPIAGVTVMVSGTKFGAVTAADGSFQVNNLPQGTHTIVARLIGYSARQARIEIGTGERAAVEWSAALNATATELTTVVTTATGDQERLKIGNSIATVNADSIVSRMQVRTVSDLLEGRVPGLTSLHTSGTVGSTTRLRVRGMRSATMANDPIVILDGVRITSEAVTEERNPNLGGRYNRTGRLDDLDPSTIESIEVLKGPSAASLYGSDAANGVIVIKTKRGQAGPAKWRVNADWTTSSYPGTFASAVRTYGHDWQGYSGSCTLPNRPIGWCPVLDSTVVFNPIDDPLTSPFARGHDAMIGANVSGGTQAFSYFFSGSFTDQLGAQKVSNLIVQMYERVNGPGSASNAFRRPNAATNTNFTGNIGMKLNADADVAVRTTLINRYQRRGLEGFTGLWSQVRSPGDTITMPVGANGVANQRYDKIARYSTALSGNWRPRGWLTMNGSYGYDFALDNDVDLLPRNSCRPFCGQNYGGEQDSLGSLWKGRRQTMTHALSFGAVATTPLTSAFTLRTGLGLQWTRSNYSELSMYASGLAAGRNSFVSASGRTALNEAADESATAGWYLDERLGWNERVFLSAGFRQDVANALGADVKPLYPKWSLSYLLSEEDFFAPLRSKVNVLRLRGAFGHAGIQPGSAHKLRSYSQLTRLVTASGVLQNYVMLVGVGNEDLRPERSVEVEYGADVELFDSRVRLDLTWFNEKTRDAIMNRPLAPSIGTTSTRRENVGTLRNTGAEMTIGATVVQSAPFTWDVNIGYGSHRNKVLNLGPNVQPFSAYGVLWGTDDSRVVAGYPLYGRWAKPIVGYHDANTDGIITMEEMRFGDSLVYIGPSEPKYTMSMSHNVSFWNGRVSVAGTFEYIDSFLQINNARANQVYQTEVMNILGAVPLEQQAFTLAGNGTTRWGFIEKTNTLRLNSLSVQTVLPRRVATAFRAQQATLSFIGNNLAMWTSYLGADPGVNTTGANGNRVIDDGTLPLARTFGLRLGLSF